MSHAHGGTQQLQVSGGANQAADTRVELDSTALLGPFSLRCSHLFRLKAWRRLVASGDRKPSPRAPGIAVTRRVPPHLPAS